MDYERLDVWRRSCRLSCELFLAGREWMDWDYRRQVTRCGMSIPSNIAEGMERLSLPDTIRFLGMAKGSCGELRTQLYIGSKIGYLNPSQAHGWINETRELSRMLAGLIKTLRERHNQPPS